MSDVDIKSFNNYSNVVQEVPIDQIIVKDRKRALYSDIFGLISSIQQIGLINPVTITKGNILIAGNHRLNACKFLGWKTIPAVVIDQSEILSELAEIDENLIRFDLVVLERANHLKRRKEIYEILHPETNIPGRGLNQHTLNKVPSQENGLGNTPSFVEDTAKKARVSRQNGTRDAHRRATAAKSPR